MTTRFLPAVCKWTVATALVLPLNAMAMDLQEAYEAAYAHDAKVKISRFQAEVTGERLEQAKAQRLPNVSFSASRHRNDLTAKTNDYAGQTVTQTNNYNSSSQALTLSQPLYRPLLQASVEQARAQVKDATASLETEEQALLQRVSQAYFEALLAQEQVQLVGVQKKHHATLLDAAQKGFAAGSGTRTDIDEAKAQVDMTVAQELEALQNQGFTLRNLELLVGKPVTLLVGLNTGSFKPVHPQPAQLQSWIDEAMVSSPQIQALQAQVVAASQEVSKAEAGHKPTVDLVAQWSRTDSDSVTSINARYDQRSVGVQINVPLYSGGYVNSTVRQAIANQERAREALEAQTIEVQMQVHKEFRLVTEGVLRIAALEQAVRSAEQAVESGRKSFAAGSRTTLDVLNAQQQLTVSMRDLSQAKYQYVLAWIRLKALAGRDRWANITKVNSWLGS